MYSHQALDDSMAAVTVKAMATKKKACALVSQ